MYNQLTVTQPFSNRSLKAISAATTDSTAHNTGHAVGGAAGSDWDKVKNFFSADDVEPYADDDCLSTTSSSPAHIKDYGMGVELGLGVAFDRPGGVVLEARGDELPGRFDSWTLPIGASVYRSSSERAARTLPRCG